MLRVYSVVYNDAMTQEQSIMATKVLRLLFLATTIAGAIRAIFFVLDPDLGLGILVMFFIIPLLVGAFIIAIKPWETKVKRTGIALTAFLLLNFYTLPFLIQSLEILLKVIRQFLD